MATNRTASGMQTRTSRSERHCAHRKGSEDSVGNSRRGRSVTSSIARRTRSPIPTLVVRRRGSVTAVSQAEMKQALRSIIGRMIRGSTRAVDMEMFSFGRRSEKPSTGGSTDDGDFALHVQCAWHLEHSGSLLVGSRDLFVPAGKEDPEEGFDWEPPDSNRRDRLLKRFLDGPARVVEDVDVDTGGYVSVRVSASHVLRILPDRSSGALEHWRFFRVGAREPHLVFTSEGAVGE